MVGVISDSRPSQCCSLLQLQWALTAHHALGIQRWIKVESALKEPEFERERQARNPNGYGRSRALVMISMYLDFKESALLSPSSNLIWNEKKSSQFPQRSEQSALKVQRTMSSVSESQKGAFEQQWWELMFISVYWALTCQAPVLYAY